MNQSIEKLRAFFADFASLSTTDLVLRVLDFVLVAGVILLLFLQLIRMKYYKLVFLLASMYLATFALTFFHLPAARLLLAVLSAGSVFGIVLIFGADIKRVLWKSKANSEKRNAKYSCSEEELIATEGEIIKALQNMSKNDVGALLVFAAKDLPQTIVDSGTRLGALISSQLLESIFHTKTPLHDGAVMVQGNKIVAAGCFLPLSQQLNIPKEYGTRHRAAIGITESYPDMVAIVVSEETGIISIAQNGALKSYADHNMLTDKLNEIYGITRVTRVNNQKFWWKK